MKKKIAIIVPGGIKGGYFNQGIPALEDYVSRISETFDVTVFSMIRTDLSYQPKNFKYIQTSATYSNSAFQKIFLLTIIFIKVHKKDKFKLLHGIWGFPSGFLAVVFGKLFGIPSVVSLQGGEAACVEKIRYGNMYRFLTRQITLWTCNKAKVLTALTHFQIRELQKFAFNRSDFFIIPYGTNPELFAFHKKELNSPFHFIHIANLNDVKDQTTLLKAFQIISRGRESILRIVGNGPDLNKLKRLTKELEIEDNVEFIGEVAHLDLPQYLKWAHVLLHTSLYEGQAVVAAEAAASGVVVCGTNVGLIDDWGGDMCIKVNCEDFDKLAYNTLALLDDPNRYFLLQKNAYLWSLSNTAAYTANSFKQVYIQNLK